MGEEVGDDIQIASEVFSVDAHVGEHKKVSEDSSESFSLWTL